MLPLGHHTIDAAVEEIIDTGGDEHLVTVLARGHDRARDPGVANGVDVANGALVGLDAVLVHEGQHDGVLARAERGHGLRVRRVVGAAVRQVDASRREKGPHAIWAGLAVDVGVIVAVRVEGDELHPPVRGPSLEVGVEHLFPRRRVDGRSLGEHAIEVEQTGAHTGGKSEQNLPFRRRDRIASEPAGSSLAPRRPGA